MSDQNQAPAVQDPDTAYATVHQRVYTPVFFKKVADDWGFQPQSDQEAMEMLTIAAQLREGYDQEMEKSAAVQGNQLTEARQHLAGALAEEGIDPGGVPDQMIVKAAQEVALDPEIANAVLSLQVGAAMAMQEAGQ